jgi:hypothetical protein
MNEITPEEIPSPEDHAYFLAIERTFLGLRKKAALLSASDWQVARGWHRQGIPVALVQDVMEKLFERQRARKAEKPGRTISGLRYFRAAVEAAWEEMLSLRAGGRPEAGEALPVQARLGHLSAALPAALPERERWIAALATLAESAGPADEVEARLRSFDAELLASLRRALGPGAQQELEAQVDQALAKLRGRLADEELQVAGRRLEEQLLRRRFVAPVLSLFSPEARGEATEPRG